jgi:hypothetical protein
MPWESFERKRSEDVTSRFYKKSPGAESFKLLLHEFLGKLAGAVVDADFERQVAGEGAGGAAEDLDFNLSLLNPS